jgi:hypothetical protein
MKSGWNRSELRSCFRRTMLAGLSGLAACALVSAPLAANPVVITFNFYPGPDGILGTPDDIPIVAPSTFAAQSEQLTDQFASVGILFIPSPPENDKNEILNNSSFSVPPSSTSPNLFASAGARTIEAIFTVPVFEVGMLLGVSAGLDRLDIYDAGNNLLDSVTGDNSWHSLQSSVPIARIVVTAVTVGTPCIDNLTFHVGQQGCYANCDGSTTAPILNVEDFTCFINEFAAAQALPHEQQLTHYANCDNSTTAPVLNVEDFTCFINRFAAGCP